MSKAKLLSSATDTGVVESTVIAKACDRVTLVEAKRASISASEPVNSVTSAASITALVLASISSK